MGAHGPLYFTSKGGYTCIMEYMSTHSCEQ